MKTLKKLFQSKFFKIISNRYFLILLIFSVWMLFFDENSFLIHQEFDNEIEELQESINFYEKEIKQNKKMIESLEDPEKLEKFAREVYQMKKEDETMFLIEFDTLKK